MPNTPQSGRRISNGHLDAQVIRLDEHVRTLATQYGELKGELGKVSAEFETSFRAITAELTTRFDRVEARFASFKDEAAARARPNWVALGSLAVGGFAVTSSLVGASFFLMTLNIRTELAPIMAQISVSAQDRVDMRRDLDNIAVDLRTRLAALRDDLNENEKADREGRARLTSDLREIETQFCAADSIRELERAQIREEIAAVRREADLPTSSANGFSPQVGRCDG